MTRRRAARRVPITLFAMVAVVSMSAIGARPATSASPEGQDRTQRVSSTLVAGITEGRGSEPDTRRIERNHDVTAHVATHPAFVRSGSGLADMNVAPQSVIAPSSNASAVSAFSIGVVGQSQEDPAIAASSTRMMFSSIERIEWVDRLDGGGGGYVWPYDLFALPVDQYYLPVTVAYSILKGRFLAVMPSFRDESSGCATGYLNVAISTSADPSKPWLVVRVAMTDAFAEIAWIGLSDDKVVITTNEWDLDSAQVACIGTSYEGSRIRVVDLADLIDGGTAIVRDVTPTSPTNYFNWLPIVEAPPPGSASAGATVDLVGDKYVGGWGNVTFARVTGSAKAGTAVVNGLVDLTAGGIVGGLTGTPAIPGFPVGGASFDERQTGVAGRAGRLWFATNGTCTPTGDSAERACARFVELDTTTDPPTLRQDGSYGSSGQDTFLAAVGMAKDGKVFLRMSRANAASPSPQDQIVVGLAADEAMENGPAPVTFFASSGTISAADFATRSSFAVDPGGNSGVWNVGPTPKDPFVYDQRLTRFIGGLTAAPGGTVLVNYGRLWSNSYRAEYLPTPAEGSPIIGVRVSASGETETTFDGERLTKGVDKPLGHSYLDLNDSSIGGSTGEGPHSFWLQFRATDGSLSQPIESVFQVDVTPPVMTQGPVSGFAVGYTVSSTSAVRTAWAGTDVGSGIWEFTINRYSKNAPGWGGGTKASSLVHALAFGKTYRYTVAAGDVAGNGSLSTLGGPWITPSAYQATSTAIKYTTGFATSTSSAYLGGSTKYASVAGKYATFTFTGRSVAFVSTKAKSRGKIYVYVDGVKKATVDLYSSTTKYRQIVWAMNVPYGTHKVTVKVAGTSGRPRVDFDAFLKL